MTKRMPASGDIRASDQMKACRIQPGDRGATALKHAVIPSNAKIIVARTEQASIFEDN
ncbi:hypothetical protein SAE02_44630 [Skermanella aerolata]|uniref:Uncharacterized protein n=1 Tax=Skermanella aerolata TaxID=393310 RepID=A0A512DV22_9PROT|nr:hypothetical protein SAE02_44630 [Skermanella aerolata]